MAPKPANLSYKAAATTPTVYVTVFTAFQQGMGMGPGTKVRLPPAARRCPAVQQTWPLSSSSLEAPQPGSKPLLPPALLQVLVHAGTGGVGLAALQVARALGCQVVATAGSAAKRAYLRRLGVGAVADSRACSFADALATASEVGGVDVVLNSLTSPGEPWGCCPARQLRLGLLGARLRGDIHPLPAAHAGMVAATLACLSPGARFAEIGKRDIWTAARIAQERPDVRYSLVAIDFLPPAVLQSSLAQLGAMLAGGRVAPLQSLTYSFEHAAAAFRQFAHAQHVGKIGMAMPTPPDAPQVRLN